MQPTFGSGVIRTPARRQPFALLELSRKSSSSNNTLVVDRSDGGVSAPFGESVGLCLFKCWKFQTELCVSCLIS